MKPLAFFFLLLSVYACRTDKSEVCFIPVEREVWNREKVLEKVTFLEDSGSYRISLYVRYVSDYEYKNLNCAVSVRGEKGEWLQDTLSVNIEPVGHVAVTEGIPLRGSLSLSKGKVRIRMEQLSQDPHLKGIKNMGLRFQKEN